ncbi:UNKNOWN [Stylonychia lemnae]|uniref:Transmembrane protein n=1 Tax=Stylonychia lemnae TaxID=5949 RepID=A0A078AKM8_STYLE|nr:UNKNOWN [Stylonychia lemnae]|eukprot:CDW82764.1 UNKNOWN [Stylonychia lemnae]
MSQSSSASYKSFDARGNFSELDQSPTQHKFQTNVLSPSDTQRTKNEIASSKNSKSIRVTSQQFSQSTNNNINSNPVFQRFATTNLDQNQVSTYFLEEDKKHNLQTGNRHSDDRGSVKSVTYEINRRVRAERCIAFNILLQILIIIGVSLSIFYLNWMHQNDKNCVKPLEAVNSLADVKLRILGLDLTNLRCDNSDYSMDLFELSAETQLCGNINGDDFENYPKICYSLTTYLVSSYILPLKSCWIFYISMFGVWTLINVLSLKYIAEGYWIFLACTVISLISRYHFRIFHYELKKIRSFILYYDENDNDQDESNDQQTGIASQED